MAHGKRSTAYEWHTAQQNTYQSPHTAWMFSSHIGLHGTDGKVGRRLDYGRQEDNVAVLSRPFLASFARVIQYFPGAYFYSQQVMPCENEEFFNSVA